MAKLDSETAQLIWELQAQLLDIIDPARTLEFWLFDSFGETERTLRYLDELQGIVTEAIERFSRFPAIQLRIANAQAPILIDIMEMGDRTIENNQQKIPALQRSIQEIEQDWK